MSRTLTDYLLEMGFPLRYLHVRGGHARGSNHPRLRLGEYDGLVGVNLLPRWPSTSLSSLWSEILDADKEGSCRGDSLIQTIGRAARNNRRARCSCTLQ